MTTPRVTETPITHGHLPVWRPQRIGAFYYAVSSVGSLTRNFVMREACARYCATLNDPTNR